MKTLIPRQLLELSDADCITTDNGNIWIFEHPDHDGTALLAIYDLDGNHELDLTVDADQADKLARSLHTKTTTSR